jgi:phosphohistidine phosphatase
MRVEASAGRSGLPRRGFQPMNLYLVQHAKAKSADLDPERPLTEEGMVDARRVASFVSRHASMGVRSILHSGLLRAQQTAQIFAEYLRPPGGVREEKELLPNSQPWSWVERLALSREDLMIVGHLPHVRRLSSLLLCQDERKNLVDYQNGGVVCLNRDESGIWVIRWVVVPLVVPEILPRR